VIVVAGEALMDVFIIGDTDEGVALEARVGGSPFNVAIGLARLRQPVAFLGSIARGRLGERLLHALTSEGVDVSCVQRLAAPTTLSLVAIGAAGVPEYAFYGSGAADRQLSLEALDSLPAATRMIHVGSYATVALPVAETLEALIEREHRQKLISYDPNVRINVEPGVEYWRTKFEWMLTRTHVLKVSEEDAELLYPGVPLAQLGSQWRDAGVAVVIATRGEKGATGWCAGGAVDIPAVSSTVVDTVGAGDSFQAALLTWFAERGYLHPLQLRKLGISELKEAMCFAATAAALTCSRRGANLPHRSELSGQSGDCK
jgi:fructokinase